MSICIDQSCESQHAALHRENNATASMSTVTKRRPRISLAKLLKLIKLWRARSSQRKVLASLNERMLKDIGYPSDEVQKEVSKPFWKE